ALITCGGCGAAGPAVDGRADRVAAAKTTAPAEIAQRRYPASPAPASSLSAETDAAGATASADVAEGTGPGQGGDKHAYLKENDFHLVSDSPLSTFSVDVDTASYSKVRAYLLTHRTLPPPDAVRIEELVNYFDYDYSPPRDDHPFAVHLETAACPWQPVHRLVRCGIQGKLIDQHRPASNLVFLIDVSGSMDAPNKLPLVKQGLQMLVRQLEENDRVAIVVYAGAAGLVLPSTSGQDQPRILSALEDLRAGGSTNGGQGILLAYRIAQENFLQGGTNRVILCSDGDFNVGVTSTGDLVRLAIEKSRAGIYLSVLGFGFGNHNDALLEELADKADGNYAFIDTQAEARKVLVEQMSGTLVTIAKDVKLQVEFNPAQVAAYRLIGYENRLLADRDFNDDAKDAGEIGAGHRVTALYEIVPIGVPSPSPQVDPLKYQPPAKRDGGSDSDAASVPAAVAEELLTLKLRYQPPHGGASRLMAFPLKDSGQKFGQATSDFQFAAAVASFGMLLRGSRHRGDTSYAAVLETAQASRGKDEHGYRAEFLELVQSAQELANAKGSERSVPQSWTEGRPAPSRETGYLAPPAVGPPKISASQQSPPGWSGDPVKMLAFGTFLGVGLAVIVLTATAALVNWISQRRFLRGMQPSRKVPIA
ncbi:MAG TPA: VWA domain-containing protein, partial [Pirellulaceae bacterium]|nr:VWA domain-containing protein [Pirellulaceae bacterium]